MREEVIVSQRAGGAQRVTVIRDLNVELSRQIRHLRLTGMHRE